MTRLRGAFEVSGRGGVPRRPTRLNGHLAYYIARRTHGCPMLNGSIFVVSSRTPPQCSCQRLTPSSTLDVPPVTGVYGERAQPLEDGAFRWMHDPGTWHGHCEVAAGNYRPRAGMKEPVQGDDRRPRRCPLPHFRRRNRDAQASN